MRQYFEKMTEFGVALNKGQILSSEKNVKNIQEVETGIDGEIEKVKNAGMPTEKINARGVMTVWQIMSKILQMLLMDWQKFPANGVLLQDLIIKSWPVPGFRDSLKIF